MYLGSHTNSHDYRVSDPMDWKGIDQIVRIFMEIFLEEYGRSEYNSIV